MRQVHIARRNVEALDICSFELVDTEGWPLPPFSAGATLQGEPREQGVEAMTWHIATPETTERTHYWYWSTRSFAISPAANSAIGPVIEHAFSQQDKPMLEAQQRRIGGRDFGSLAPVLLPGDAAAVRVRRKLDSMIQTMEKCS